MLRGSTLAVVFILLCLNAPLARGERGRNEESRNSKQSPGGAWSERSHQGGEGHKNYNQSHPEQEANVNKSEEKRNRGETATPGEQKSVTERHNESTSSGSHDAAAGATFEKHNEPNFSGSQGAAAGASAANRREPQYSGAEGAATGAAAANRREPQYSGAEGAATGAAAANRRGPQYSGAQGAAAGAALSKRNQPQYSGAEGAAAGAALANRNQPQVSGAAGAAAGAAAANANQPPLNGAQGAAIGAAAASQNSAPLNGAQGAALAATAATQNGSTTVMPPSAAAGSGAVTSAFSNYGLFSPQWSTEHSEAWTSAHVVGGTLWAPTNWNAVAVYTGAHGQPVWYDYGDNVVYQNGNIMMAGQSLGTAEEFSQQAAEIADTGFASEPPADSDWMPLGVFAMVRDEHQHPQMILQLAMNKQGLLRGNFTDEVTEHTQPVRGGYDLRTKRAAWIVGDHKTAVMEAGLSNLAEGDAPALIHKNGKTDHWLLVRLKQPPTQAEAP
jgi:hypothetical protein